MPDFLGGWHSGYLTRRCCSKPLFNPVESIVLLAWIMLHILHCRMYNLLPSPQKRKIKPRHDESRKQSQTFTGNTSDPKNWNTRIPAPTTHHSKSTTSYRHYTIQLDRRFHEAQSRLANILGCVL